jgi:chromosome segregation ATPase
MEAAFQKLDDTVSTINAKILTSTQMAKDYKSKIMDKLEALLNQINMLKEDANKSPVPELRQQLLTAQQNLAEKNTQLEESQSKLDELTSRISQLNGDIEGKQNEINDLNSQLEILANEKEEERKQNIINTNAFAESQDANAAHEAAFKELQRQIQVLTTEKEACNQKLIASQQELDNFIRRIGEINARLASEISKIDTILQDFGDGSDVSEKIESIGTNLASIIQIINNPVGGRRKTKKHKKMRGGYLYSRKSNSNSNSSSINRLSRSKSRSKSKSKSKSKKNIF